MLRSDDDDDDEVLLASSTALYMHQFMTAIHETNDLLNIMSARVKDVPIGTVIKKV